ncbi:hypothetical protein DLAC_07344 [Tieghemostelium lacteum]|uniref:Uncharacterized protein n=1 Tax=Tieghemostelium lacteum TaxID=361077 RepID=A0A151ZCH2_TIELA|nr:hypothetical protein DLAC_07344 [Tieghemostelium lacteum]|eukprot:KYQ91574.1 hypothetical protein DLAC_07344 [Tieghemostelium lacteum]
MNRQVLGLILSLFLVTVAQCQSSKGNLYLFFAPQLVADILDPTNGDTSPFINVTVDDLGILNNLVAVNSTTVLAFISSEAYGNSYTTVQQIQSGNPVVQTEAVPDFYVSYTSILGPNGNYLLTFNGTHALSLDPLNLEVNSDFLIELPGIFEFTVANGWYETALDSDNQLLYVTLNNPVSDSTDSGSGSSMSDGDQEHPCSVVTGCAYLATIDLQSQTIVSIVDIYNIDKYFYSLTLISFQSETEVISILKTTPPTWRSFKYDIVNFNPSTGQYKELLNFDAIDYNMVTYEAYDGDDQIFIMHGFVNYNISTYSISQNIVISTQTIDIKYEVEVGPIALAYSN